MPPCILVDGCQHFGRIFSFDFLSRKEFSFIIPPLLRKTDKTVTHLLFNHSPFKLINIQFSCKYISHINILKGKTDVWWSGVIVPRIPNSVLGGSKWWPISPRGKSPVGQEAKCYSEEKNFCSYTESNPSHPTHKESLKLKNNEIPGL
jgi:hypothetical protein